MKALFEEFGLRDVAFAQKLVRQAWGGTDFHIRDPDGNVVSFVQYRISSGHAPRWEGLPSHTLPPGN